jgi:hypothetical protein
VFASPPGEGNDAIAYNVPNPRPASTRLTAEGIVASRNMPAEPDEEGEGALFSCPFCGSEDADCPHFLGSRDLNFCSDFGVDADGGLGQLNEQFEELGESVKAFLAGGYKKSGTKAARRGKSKNPGDSAGEKDRDERRGVNPTCVPLRTLASRLTPGQCCRG